ncbi:hypothetical protein [Aquisphaera insulae]|uniref:hypothetical protein n=1 Tax=Aquisphaera insulae TaxID=2712864 RepID=UPI0013ED8F9F|nr:hypothetical protein [Aquisphaera insulae]
MIGIAIIAVFMGLCVVAPPAAVVMSLYGGMPLGYIVDVRRGGLGLIGSTIGGAIGFGVVGLAAVTSVFVHDTSFPVTAREILLILLIVFPLFISGGACFGVMTAAAFRFLSHFQGGLAGVLCELPGARRRTGSDRDGRQGMVRETNRSQIRGNGASVGRGADLPEMPDDDPVLAAATVRSAGSVDGPGL